jgi:nanoRNase/pAp phosphatase (c-di-AMP/oligoRNAs hydrolase)
MEKLLTRKKKRRVHNPQLKECKMMAGGGGHIGVSTFPVISQIVEVRDITKATL